MGVSSYHRGPLTYTLTPLFFFGDQNNEKVWSNQLSMSTVGEQQYEQDDDVPALYDSFQRRSD